MIFPHNSIHCTLKPEHTNQHSVLYVIAYLQCVPLISWKALKRCYQKWHLWVTIKVSAQQATWFSSSWSHAGLSLYSGLCYPQGGISESQGPGCSQSNARSARPWDYFLEVTRELPHSHASVTGFFCWTIVQQSFHNFEWKKWRPLCRFMFTWLIILLIGWSILNVKVHSTFMVNLSQESYTKTSEMWLLLASWCPASAVPIHAWVDEIELMKQAWQLLILHGHLSKIALIWSLLIHVFPLLTLHHSVHTWTPNHISSLGFRGHQGEVVFLSLFSETMLPASSMCPFQWHQQCSQKLPHPL